MLCFKLKEKGNNLNDEKLGERLRLKWFDFVETSEVNDDVLIAVIFDLIRVAGIHAKISHWTKL